MLSHAQYTDLVAQGYNRIPLSIEALADTETPLSAYLKLARGPYSFVFESVEGGEKWGRYSIIGLNAQQRYEARGNTLTHFDGKTVLSQTQSPDILADIERIQNQYNVYEHTGLPVFSGGLVGYFGYDCVRYIEKKLEHSAPKDELNTPDICLMVCEELVVFDNLRGKIHIIVHANTAQDDAYVQACDRLNALKNSLLQPVPALPDLVSISKSSDKPRCEANFISSYGENAFKADVDKIKDYVFAGDTMQVVISQRMSHDFTGEPINLYRALRCQNPSPYMYFLDFGDHQIVGSSPEILTRMENNEVTVRPIAGTRRRGKSEQEDLALEKELINDPKEIAEHLMLIDLGRNDVGRVAQTGSVKLTEKMVVERFSHVMHITSNVTGQLKPELTAMDVLRATLPAGTLSGAPKVRAMEIIDQLEPVKRGIYGGAIGYLSWDGGMDTAIAIRTAVIKNNTVYVQAGAGVVADSQPDLEWKETMNKARALFGALDWVQ